MRKQRYYGSVELMVSTDASGRVKNMGCYRVEPADSIKSDIYVSVSKRETNKASLNRPSFLLARR